MKWRLTAEVLNPYNDSWYFIASLHEDDDSAGKELIRLAPKVLSMEAKDVQLHRMYYDGRETQTATLSISDDKVS